MSRKIVATFVPQAWRRNYAIDVDPEGETTWDVTKYILSLSLRRIRTMRDDTYDSVDLRYAGSLGCPKWIMEWIGPFYICIEDSISDFFGVLAPSEVTQEILDNALREEVSRKTYCLPCTWTEEGTYVIEASSLQEAIDTAYKSMLPAGSPVKYSLTFDIDSILDDYPDEAERLEFL